MIKAGALLLARSTRSGGLCVMLTVSSIADPAGAVEGGAQQAMTPPIAAVDCVTVRHYVAEHGRAKSIAWAVRNGYSWAQINEARRCLKG